MSMVTITVSVTQSDIDNGKRSDCWLCPIALALWRATGWRWIVGGERASECARIVGHAEKYELPDRVWEFVDRFDDDRTTASVRPFEFEMRVPEWASGIGNERSA